MKISAVINDLIKDLDQRQKDVIEARFGLKGVKQTLAAIGKKYRLTRERIRQIETASLDIIRKKFNNSPAEKITKTALLELKKFSGVRTEDDFIKDLRILLKDNGINGRDLKFIFEVAKNPEFYRRDKNYHDFWYADKEVFKKAAGFINNLAEAVKNKKEEIIVHKKFKVFFNEVLKARGIDAKTAFNYLAVSKKFKTNSFGDFGLSHWEEIDPKTIRSKIYVILKRHGKPLYFREISERINKADFGGPTARYRTVHNELIKDPRFVLVGRGMYGLAEFGLEPGAAKDVIERVLKNKGPLPKEEVINLVLQERFLKPNTILLNLQNKKHFKKLADGRYHIA